MLQHISDNQNISHTKYIALDNVSAVEKIKVYSQNKSSNQLGLEISNHGKKQTTIDLTYSFN